MSKPNYQDLYPPAGNSATSTCSYAAKKNSTNSCVCHNDKHRSSFFDINAETSQCQYATLTLHFTPVSVLMM